MFKAPKWKRFHRGMGARRGVLGRTWLNRGESSCSICCARAGPCFWPEDVVLRYWHSRCRRQHLPRRRRISRIRTHRRSRLDSRKRPLRASPMRSRPRELLSLPASAAASRMPFRSSGTRRAWSRRSRPKKSASSRMFRSPNRSLDFRASPRSALAGVRRSSRSAAFRPTLRRSCSTAASRRVRASIAQSSSTNIPRSLWPVGRGLQDARCKHLRHGARRARSTFERFGRSNMESAPIALNFRGQLDEGGGRNQDFSKFGWRGSASYIDQNESGTLGWMMSYAHLAAPSHIDETKNWFYGD